MSEEHVTIMLPSGKEVNITSPTLSGNNIITNPALVRSGENTQRFIESVSDLSLSDVKGLLIGDLTYMLIQVRMLHRGEEYEFRAHCPHCGDVATHTINLNDLEVYRLDREKVTVNENGNYVFEVTLPKKGDTLTARLLKASDQPRLNKIRKNESHRILSALMSMRTIAINGQPNTNPVYFDTLHPLDEEHFSRVYDEFDCGYDTTVELACNNCYSEFDFDVPFDSTFFLGNRKSSRKK